MVLKFYNSYSIFNYFINQSVILLDQNPLYSYFNSSGFPIPSKGVIAADSTNFNNFLNESGSLFCSDKNCFSASDENSTALTSHFPLKLFANQNQLLLCFLIV